MLAKRIFDLAVATLALVVLWPLLLLIALVIKIESDGPIFYRGLRAGRFGVPFRIFKFRTMVVNAESLAFQGQRHLMTRELPKFE